MHEFNLVIIDHFDKHHKIIIPHITEKMTLEEIADKIVAALKVDDLVSTVNITGPGFITMRLSDTYIQSQILEKAKDRTRLGITKIAAPQRVIVDFSSPNIAKEMHVVSATILYRLLLIFTNKY
jgi:arginyl-tRNA synthetase